MDKKASELFEGDKSSLKKTFDDAVNQQKEDFKGESWRRGYNTGYDEAKYEILTELSEEVERIKIRKPIEDSDIHIHIKRGAYNKAISDILSLINSKK